ncbi:MAG: hypothetical protein CL607_10880 [Anaerolineaceae bacterium]|nr:hypothetical protein [Anaerolineaceae bacterium]
MIGARGWLFALIGLLLVACQPPATDVWGPVINFGTIQHDQPPAIMPTSQGTVFVWSDADATEARLYAATARKPATILALPTTISYQHSTYPALNDNAHLLWIDQPLDEGPRLMAATYSPDLIALTGPIKLSRRDTYHYAAASLPDGGLRIVWTSGFISEPTLYTLTIDGMGRPSFAEEVRFFVTHPALVRDGRGDLWLFWLWEGDVYRGRLVDTALEDVEVVTSDVALQRGDYLDAFYAVMDETHTYLLWQVSRADGSWDVQWSIGTKVGDVWTPPRPLAFAVDPEATVQTGFNSGTVQAARSGSNANLLQLARPLPGQNRSVPLSVVTQGEEATTIGVLYLQNGALLGYQSLAGATVLRAPTIAADPSLYLTLAWGQLGPAGTTLNFITSQPDTE